MADGQSGWVADEWSGGQVEMLLAGGGLLLAGVAALLAGEGLFRSV